MTESDFIPGIYNYCNRWCERCPFTHACRVYADTREFEEKHGPEPSMEATMEYVGESLSRTMELLRADAAKHGIDIDNLPEVEVVRLPLTGKEEELVSWCRDYYKSVKAFFDKHMEAVKEQMLELVDHFKMGIPGVEDKMKRIRDAIDTIQWHQYFIYVKCRRALNKCEGEEWPDNDPVQNDANGTAKIARIAVRDSLASWEVLLGHFEPGHDDILDILALLKRILARSGELFPRAEEFVRAGFDEGEGKIVDWRDC